MSAVFLRRDGVETVLARESGSQGRLRSAVDAAASSAEALRDLGRDLVVVNGQHESIALRQRGEALRLLDASAKVSTDDLVAVRRRLHEAHRERDALGGDASRRTQELEFLEYRIGVIEAAKILGPHELRETVEELTRLSELRDGQAALAAALEAMDGDGEAALTRLARAIADLPAGQAYDAPRAELRGALEQARDAVRDLTALGDESVVDAAAFDALEARVTALQALARQYGGSLDSTLETLGEMRARRDGAARCLRARRRARRRSQRTPSSARSSWPRPLGETGRRRRRTLSAALARQLPRVALAHATLRFTVDGVRRRGRPDPLHAQPGTARGPAVVPGQRGRAEPCPARPGPRDGPR